jgi:hypothetical protein
VVEREAARIKILLQRHRSRIRVREREPGKKKAIASSAYITTNRVDTSGPVVEKGKEGWGKGLQGMEKEGARRVGGKEGRRCMR